MATDGAGEGGRLRTVLLALVALGAAGLVAELLLLEHVDEWRQWIPLVSLALGLAATVAVALRATPATLRAFQAAMLVFVVAGALGVVLHYLGNTEFEREHDRTVHGLALFWRSLHGATPALAPGALAQLGLLGLAFAWRHPAFHRPRDGEPSAARDTFTRERNERDTG